MIENKILFFVLMLFCLWLLLTEKGRSYVKKTAKMLIKSSKLETASNVEIEVGKV
jgi:hypothetical protein